MKLKSNCEECDKPISSKDSRTRFCSVSCSVRFNNRFNKRSKGKCSICGDTIRKSRKYCVSCLETRKSTGKKKKLEHFTISNLTIKEVTYKYSNKYTRIREHARRVAIENGLLNNCAVCGYDKFVQACHKKPINSFNEDTPIVVVNSTNNLVGLCPNHHKEFDHGLITID